MSTPTNTTTKTAPDLRAVLQQALETLDHDPVSLAEVAAWIPRKVVAIAAIRAALDAPAAASGAGTPEPVNAQLLSATQRIVSWDRAGMAMTADHIAQAERAIAAALAAAPAAAPVVEVTDAMVAAYLQAHTAYWQRVDEQPTKLGKWRNGTPSEATRESLRAVFELLAAAPAAPAAAPVAGDLAEQAKQHAGRSHAIVGRLYNDPPSTANDVAAGQWMQTAAQFLIAMAAAPQAPAAAQAQPLTPEQRHDGFLVYAADSHALTFSSRCFAAGVKFAEEHHGIGGAAGATGEQA